MSQSSTVAIIAAAGTGERLGAHLPKGLVEIDGSTLIERAVRELLPLVSKIVIAAPAGFEKSFRKLFVDSRIEVVTGGGLRSQSVAKALSALQTSIDKNKEIKYVLVHDAARAFAPTSLAQKIINSLIAGEEAVIPALEVIDTIKIVNAAEYVLSTPERAHVRAVQTPQGFTIDVLSKAHESGESATDDATLVAKIGIPVKVIPGSLLARKITTVEDLIWAKEMAGSK